MKTLRTAKQVISYLRGCGIIEDMLSSIDIVIQNDLYNKGCKVEGCYIPRYGKEGKPTIFIRSLRDTALFNHVCLHELGHHAHYYYMPIWTKGATESQKEEYAERFARGGYKQFC